MTELMCKAYSGPVSMKSFTQCMLFVPFDTPSWLGGFIV